ncbi:right-handed parallel beta-helix repeat-containing protein [Micromonospora sp. NPDC000663]|uniref:right-handed parallel beta-helix repeat-containing protein n=1 Tax=Micromonospora sp. NPDC000663 TaxID=3364218 RepID=UPI0036969B6F
MSDDETSTDGGASAALPARRRRALWVAGVAGLTGAVGLAALGGVAARDDKPTSDRASDAQSATRQNVSDAGGSDDAGKQDGAKQDGGRSDDWSGVDDRSGKDDRRDDMGRTEQVPCDTDKLIQAITFANSRDGGVLELARGCTYTLTRNQNGDGLPVITQPITLRGENTTIGRDATADYFRILNVGPGGHLTLKGLSIRGGQTLGRAMTMDAATVWAPYSPSVRSTTAKPADAPTAKPTVAKAATVGKLAAKAKSPATAKAAAPTAMPATAGPAVQLVEEPGLNDGAGVLVQPGGRAEILDSELLYNQAGGNGGGLANFGTTRLSKTTVAHNTAFFFGGGIFNAGVLQVDESKVKDNNAIIGGGGIANGAARILTDDVDGGSAWIYKSEIADNRTLGFGGGVLDVGGTTTLHETTVRDNTAVLAGGGVAVANSQLSLQHATVAGNSTAGVGGGVAVTFDSIATVEDTSSKDNTAGFFGAGLFSEESVTALRDSEVVGNRAVGPLGAGGGIYITDGGEVTLHRTTVAHNVATLAPGGIFNNLGSTVTLDDESSASANRPTNCFNVPDCFA